MTLVTQLTASGPITNDDLFIVIDDPAGTAKTKKATAQQVLNLVNSSSFVEQQLIHVSKNGNDSNNGSTQAPFLTLSGAMASITDASPSKRYVIHVAPGSYTESGNFDIKPNVFIVGEQREGVRISATSFGMSSLFSGSSGLDNRSGFSNCTLASACNFDWNTVQSPAGKLYFSDIQFNSTVTLNGYNNAIAQAQFRSCLFFGVFTVSGINVGVHNNNTHFSTIILNQHSTLQTQLVAAGGNSGAVTATTTVDNWNRAIRLFARNFWMDGLTINGPSNYADITVTSVKETGPTVLNGATLKYINPSTGASYTPTSGYQWQDINAGGTAPSTVAGALDTLGFQAWSSWLWRKWTRYGVTDMANSQDTFTVNFEPFASLAYAGNSTNYVVNLTISNTSSASPLFLQTMVTSKNSGSFTFKTNVNTDSGNYKAEWYLTEQSYTFEASGSY